MWETTDKYIAKKPEDINSKDEKTTYKAFIEWAAKKESVLNLDDKKRVRELLQEYTCSIDETKQLCKELKINSNTTEWEFLKVARKPKSPEEISFLDMLKNVDVLSETTSSDAFSAMKYALRKYAEWFDLKIWEDRIIDISAIIHKVNSNKKSELPELMKEWYTIWELIFDLVLDVSKKHPVRSIAIAVKDIANRLIQMWMVRKKARINFETKKERKEAKEKSDNFYNSIEDTPEHLHWHSSWWGHFPALVRDNTKVRYKPDSIQPPEWKHRTAILQYTNKERPDPNNENDRITLKKDAEKSIFPDNWWMNRYKKIKRFIANSSVYRKRMENTNGPLTVKYMWYSIHIWYEKKGKWKSRKYKIITLYDKG